MLAINKVFALDWEKLPNTPCRAYGNWGKVFAIGHYLKDEWLWLDTEKMAFVVTPFDRMRAAADPQDSTELGRSAVSLDIEDMRRGLGAKERKP